MGNELDRELSQKYCPRFAKIAVDRGFITTEEAKEALSEQVDDDLLNKPHRLIGRILLDNGLITPEQIEMVLNDLFRKQV
jgi:hypothetical protein